MKRKTFLLILCTFLVVQQALATQNYQFSATAITGQTLYFNIVDGNAQVVYPEELGFIWDDYWYGYTKPTGNLSIPSSVTYNDSTYSVTSICNNAFSGCTGLTSVTIPNTITIIYSGAFSGCNGLTAFTLPNSVTALGSGILASCNNLISISVASGNTYFDSRNNSNAIIETSSNTLIQGCRNTVIPNTVNHIGGAAFLDCIGLTSITIPSSVNSIGGSAFANCINLSSIIIPSSVYILGDHAFANCTGLTSLTIPNSVTNIDSYCFSGCSGLTTITIGTGVDSIFCNAFENCSSLTTVFFNPDNCSFTGFHPGAYLYANKPPFFNCNNISSIIIGDNVQVIPSVLCDSFPNLTSIYYSGNLTQWCNITHGYNKFATHALFISDSLVTNLIIPDSISAIGNNTFSYCNSLTSLAIPNNVVSIGASAFESCNNLSNVSIGNNVTSIGLRAFAECIGINTIILPDSVNYIGGGAFWGCTGIDTIIIPNSVNIIGDGAFSNCENMTTLTIGTGVDSIGSNAFQDCYRLTTVSFNADSCVFAGSSYPTLETHDLSYNRIFYHCNSISSFTFGNTVKIVPPLLCRGMHLLSTITIPKSIIRIGREAFSHIDTVYMMPTTAPILGENAFYTTTIYTTTFVLVGCSYDSYYNDPSWIDYRNYLHETGIEINVETNTNNDDWGNVIIMQQRGHDVRCDSTAVVLATPYYGYHFVHWSNGRTTNPDTLYLSGDSIISAVFEPNLYILNATINNPSFGMVSFPYGDTSFYLDTIMVIAQPSAHYHTVGWNNVTRVSASKDTAWIEMTADITISCIFAIDTYSVFAISSDILRGSVSGGGEFEYATPCTVTATPYSDYTFGGWSNGSTANPYTFAVSENTTLTAIFLAPGEETYTVSIHSANPNMGSANVNGSDAITVLDGTEVVVTATANNGFHFLQWNGGNAQNPRYLTVTQDTTLIAFFESDLVEYTINVYSGNGEMGSVNGGGTYNNGDTIIITATPYNGFRFVQWNDGDTSNPRSIIVNSDSTFIAYFNSIEGIADVLTSHIRVSQDNGQITIEGIKKGDVIVFDISGRLITSTYAEGESLSFSVPSSGIYFIKPKTMNIIKICVIK